MGHHRRCTTGKQGVRGVVHDDKIRDVVNERSSFTNTPQVLRRLLSHGLVEHLILSPSGDYLNPRPLRGGLRIVKLSAHPVRTGQGRQGFPGRKFLSYCAPSCLPVGRDPAYPALAGRGTFRSSLSRVVC